MAKIESIRTGLYRMPLPTVLTDSTHGVMEDFELVPASITRRCVANLKAELPTGPFAADTRPCRDESPARGRSAARAATKKIDVRTGQTERAGPGNLVVLVEMDGTPHALIVSVAPDLAGHVFVQPHPGGPRRLVPAADLKLLGFANA